MEASAAPASSANDQSITTSGTGSSQASQQSSRCEFSLTMESGVDDGVIELQIDSPVAASSVAQPISVSASKLPSPDSSSSSSFAAFAATKASDALPVSLSLSTSSTSSTSPTSLTVEAPSLSAQDEKDLFQLFSLIGNKKDFGDFVDLLKNNSPERVDFLIGKLFQEIDKIKEKKEKEKRFQFVKESLIARFPTIMNCVYQGVVQVDGIKIMVKKLKEKGSLKEIDCLVCENIEDLKVKARDFIKDNPGKGCGFIVQNPGFGGSSMHVTPLYIFPNKADPNKFECVILDSVGTSKGDYSQFLQLGLEKEFAKRGGSPISAYHHYSKKRQSDSRSCPIFAIRDIVEISKDPAFFVEFIRKKSQLASKGALPKEQTFSELPLRMLKVTQNIADLTQILVEEQHMDLRDPNLVVKSKKGVESFRDRFIEKGGRHVSIIKDKDANVYVSEKFRKYEKMIILEVVRQEVQRSGLDKPEEKKKAPERKEKGKM